MPLSTEYRKTRRRSLVLTSALALFCLHVGLLGQNVPGPVKTSGEEYPPLGVGQSLPEAWLQKFKNEDLRNWLRANVRCQSQLLSYDRFGISATDQLAITPATFNRLQPNERLNLLTFELGKVFFKRVIEAYPQRRSIVEDFSTEETQEMVRAEYPKQSGVSPGTLGVTDGPWETVSKFGYVFRIELLDMSSRRWEETRRKFHAVVDPLLKNASLPANGADLADWVKETQSFAQYVETMDVMEGRLHRWQALERWTQSACQYMTQEDVSGYFPEAARDEVELVKASRTYLLNNLVVLDDEEIASGLASAGNSLSACQKNLIAVIRSVSAPIDAVWFVQQMDEQRATYNARLKAESEAYRRELLNAQDPVIEVVKMIAKVVERGAGKLVDGIKFPFVYVGNANGAGGTYSSPGLGGPGGYRSPTMGPTYQYLKGIAASGGVIPLQ